MSRPTRIHLFTVYHIAAAFRFAHDRSPMLKRLLNILTWPPIAFGSDAAISIERNLQHLVDWVLIQELVQRIPKQAFLGLQIHVFRRNIQADETRVHFLASNQPAEVRSIVRHQHPVVADSLLHMLPVFGSLPPKPRDMSTLESCIPCDLGEVGTEALVNQELHKDEGKSSSEVSLDERGCCCRQGGCLCGLARRGNARVNATAACTCPSVR